MSYDWVVAIVPTTQMSVSESHKFSAAFRLFTPPVSRQTNYRFPPRGLFHSLMLYGHNQMGTVRTPFLEQHVCTKGSSLVEMTNRRWSKLARISWWLFLWGKKTSEPFPIQAPVLKLKRFWFLYQNHSGIMKIQQNNKNALIIIRFACILIIQSYLALTQFTFWWIFFGAVFLMLLAL